MFIPRSFPDTLAAAETRLSVPPPAQILLAWVDNTDQWLCINLNHIPDILHFFDEPNLQKIGLLSQAALNHLQSEPILPGAPDFICDWLDLRTNPADLMDLTALPASDPHPNTSETE